MSVCVDVYASTTGLSEVSVISVLARVYAVCQDNPHARMYASHSWSVCSHSIVQFKRSPLHYAAQNDSAQAAAMVARLLQGKADANAVDSVSAWDGGMVVGWHVYMDIYATGC